MGSSGMILGILPLIIFVIVDSFLGLKKAVIVLIISALAEGVISYVLFKDIDSVTVFSIVIAIIMGVVSYIKQTPIFVKMQPVILGICIGAVLLISHWMGKPFMWEMLTKYKEFLPAQFIENMNHPVFKDLIIKSNEYFGYAIILNALFIAWAALKFSNLVWILMRGVGFYVFLFMAFFMAKMRVGL